MADPIDKDNSEMIDIEMIENDMFDEWFREEVTKQDKEDENPLDNTES